MLPCKALLWRVKTHLLFVKVIDKTIENFIFGLIRLSKLSFNLQFITTHHWVNTLETYSSTHVNTLTIWHGIFRHHEHILLRPCYLLLSSFGSLGCIFCCPCKETLLPSFFAACFVCHCVLNNLISQPATDRLSSIPILAGGGYASLFS